MHYKKKEKKNLSAIDRSTKNVAYLGIKRVQGFNRKTLSIHKFNAFGIKIQQFFMKIFFKTHLKNVYGEAKGQEKAPYLQLNVKL